MASLKLDKYHSRWSYIRGATKACERTSERAITDLAEALAEVDGILAGINYLEKVEPKLDETSSVPPQSENSADNVPSNTGECGWLGHLTIGLPKLDATNGISPEERSNIETRQLRNHLNSKLTASDNNSKQQPRASQWATLRSLREAMMYYYQQFTKATAESTLPEIRKLRKSYVTAKNMLEVGILTFRNVLHGQIPTTLMDIFAFASLSYVISKILHAKGHLDESDILSGILDWRNAIADESEMLAFDDIAMRLWPEAKDIMHFIPMPRKGMSPKPAGSVDNEFQSTRKPSPQLRPQMGDANSTQTDEPTLPEDPLPSVQEFHEIMMQANTISLPFTAPFMSDNVDERGGLQDHAFHLIQGTKSHEDLMFSDFLDWDNMPPADFMDQSLHPTVPPD